MHKILSRLASSLRTVMTMRDIHQLHPELQDKIRQLKILCEAQGLALGIAECLRTVEEQDALYAQGRTAPGSIVTYARGEDYGSQHQWGIAFDFFQNIPGHAYDDLGFFANVGTLAKSIGLAWGGDWIGFVDRPHLYLPYWGDTPAPLKREYGTPDAFMATWDDPPALYVDGWWGPKTTKRLQQIFGTPQDGVISDQWAFWRDANPGLTSAEWVDHPTEGSPLVRKIQEMVGAYVDGIIGPETITAMQIFFGSWDDGVMDGPSPLVAALQAWANEQP